MGLRLVLSFEEPDYNEIISVVVNQVFPDIDEEKGDESFMPVLKAGVEIIQDMPQEDKGRFAFYILNSLLTSDKTPDIFRSLENICKSTLNIEATIESISASREELGDGVKMGLDISLDDIDYYAVVDKLFEIEAIDEAVPWFIKGTARVLSNIGFVVEWLLSIINMEKTKTKILTVINEMVVEKTGIHINNLDYEYNPSDDQEKEEPEAPENEDGNGDEE